MFEWFFDGMTGFGDFFANWWGFIIGIGIIIFILLTGFMIYMAFKAFIGI